MTRLHVILIAGLLGFVTGVAAPVHAASYGKGITHADVYVSSIDADVCTISTDDGSLFQLDDCDDLDYFSEGDAIEIEEDTQQGFTTLISAQGDSIGVSQ